MSGEIDKLKKERDYFYNGYCKLQARVSVHEKENADLKAKSKFGISVLAKDDALIKTFTGLPSISCFNYVFEKVEPNIPRLEYYRGRASLAKKQQKRKNKNRRRHRS